MPQWRNWNTCLPAGRRARFRNKLIDKNMKYTAYAIKSMSRNYIYVGLTNDLNKRFKQHNSGKETTTKPYAPFELIYTEILLDRTSARKREKYLKSGVGKEFLKNLLNNAQVAKLADAHGSGPCGSNPVGVQISPWAPRYGGLPADRQVQILSGA